MTPLPVICTLSIAEEILFFQARKAAAAVGLVCKVGFEKKPWVFDAPVGEFWIRTVPPEITTHPGHIETHAVGIMQFTLYAQEGQEQQRALVMANNLKEWMEEQVWHSEERYVLVTEKMKVVVMIQKRNGRCVTIVDGAFDVWVYE